MTSISTRPRIAALLLIPLLLTGCGPKAPWANDSDDEAKYNTCLREHGMTVTQDGDATKVEVPDPKIGRAAREACKKYAPSATSHRLKIRS